MDQDQTAIFGSRALPADNVLRQAMEDYEKERDDLRFCP
jgi:hypothetical protein